MELEESALAGVDDEAAPHLGEGPVAVTGLEGLPRVLQHGCGGRRSRREVLGEHYLFIGGGILLAHAVGKAGLFWLLGVVGKSRIADWHVLAQHPLLLTLMAALMIGLVGLPPFPGFFAKWQVIAAALSAGFVWLAVLPIHWAGRRSSVLPTASWSPKP